MLVGAVGIELVGQSLSLAESAALTPLHPSKTLLEHRILATSWPRIFLSRSGPLPPPDCFETTKANQVELTPQGRVTNVAAKPWSKSEVPPANDYGT